MTALLRLPLTFFCLVLSLTLAAQLPLNEAGWSQVAPGPDSRVIYVSSSEGDNANDGLSPESPVATIERAAALARPGQPDHILLKTGDTFRTRFGIGNFHSGKSPEEPTVISYYGGGSVRPVVDCENHFMSTFRAERSHIAIIGIDFYASAQDPNAPQFNPEVFHGSRTAFSIIGSSGGNLLIEDCKFRYIGLGAFTAQEPGDFTNIKIRRNIVVDAWADSTYFEHYSDGRNRQQGMYIEDTRGVLIEENLFDHNGWNEQVPGAGKNKFNHNVYMQVNNPDSDQIRVRGNILARASAHGIQMRSGGRATDNLFVQNSVNVNVGYPPQPPADPSANGYVADNVFLEVVRMDSTEEVVNNPQRSGALWGVNTINLPSVVENNIFAHALNTETNVIAVGDYDDVHDLGGELVKRDNIDYRWFSKTEAPDPSWFDPNRQLGDYSRRLGLAPTTEAFLLAARQRPLQTWPEELTAYAANAYIRAGFATDGEDAVAPPAPDTAFVRQVTGETALVSWTWALDDVRTVGYNVYLNGTKVNTAPVPTDSLQLTGLSFLTAYTVTIRTVDVGGNESVAAATVSFTTDEADTIAPLPPAAPPSVVEKTQASVTLSWNPGSDNRAVTGYYLYRDGSLVTTDAIDDTMYTVTGLEIAQTYQFAVAAIDGAGNESVRSDTLRVKTLDPIRPTDPANVTAVLSGERTIQSSWSPATDNDTLAGYNVYVNYRGGDEPVIYTEDTTVVFEALGPPPYAVRVAAVDVSGNESRLTQPVNAERSVSNRPLDPAELGLQLYPNPGRSNVYISLVDREMIRLQVIDGAGRVVRQQRLAPTRQHTLDTATLPTGVYYLLLDLADGSRTRGTLKVVR